MMRALRCLGFQPRQCRAAILSISFAGQGADLSARADYMAAVTARELSSQQIRAITSAGTPFWLEVTLSPVFSAEGLHSNVIAVGRDVSPARAAHEKEMSALVFEQRKHDESRLLAEFNKWLN